jgi:hypothetical protein
MDDTTTEYSEAEMRGGDLLVGADAIRAFLIHLGLPGDTDVYYLRRARRWPIGKTGGKGGSLIASKRRLSRYAEEITRGEPNAVEQAEARG